ncbi:MAG: HAMP domain-containing histidine kinase [Planctomycetota bacterium]|nr:MAG: HAMP domain-containing histidine kinase [Planctomycetota bacterium]
MASTIEKRLSLHKNLAEQRLQNEALESQMTRLQALANIGTATYMVAHEINNLLTPLANFATLALNNPDDKILAEKALRKAIQNCGRASKIMESMLAVANGQTQEKKNTSLIVLVEDIFNCLCRDFSKDAITVDIQIPEDLLVWAVPVQIQQVLMNLILNAREAMLPRGGVLTIKAEDIADSLQIELADTGNGIEPTDLEKIFEPFFTTKVDKKSPSQCSGSGLGLVFVKRIIDIHGGAISVESTPAKGSTFKITLPKP